MTDEKSLQKLFFRSKTLLIWCRFRSFSGLSLNITREICEYLSYDHYPLSYTGDYRGLKLYVQVFDWKKGEMIRVCQIHEAISDVSLVYIHGNRIVVTGGLRGEFYEDYDDIHYPDRTSILINLSNYTHLPYLQLPRFRHSSAYDPVRNWVYVLGGLQSLHPASALRESEGMDMQEKGKWTVLAAMKRPRYLFSTVVYQSNLYIAGGGCEVMETYDPVLDVFTLLPIEIPGELVRERWVGTVERGKWVVMCRKGVVRVGLEEKQQERFWELTLESQVVTGEVRGGTVVLVDCKGHTHSLRT